MVRKFNPEGPAPQFYSHGAEVRAGSRLVFVSGQVGVGADGRAAEGIEAQTRQATANLKAVLAAAGMTLDNVAKLTIYMTNPADMPGFMAGAPDLASTPPAATTLLFVSALASPDYRIEIEAVAAGD